MRLEAGALLVSLAVGLGDASVYLTADLVDGVDPGLSESGCLSVDDGVVDLEAAEDGAEGSLLARRQCRGNEGKVGEIHEAAACIRLGLAEGALELEGLLTGAGWAAA